MTLPEMIIFDYGYTLIYEPLHDSLRGTQALLEHATRNKNNMSAGEVSAFADKMFADISVRSDAAGLEIHNHMYQKLVYEYLEIDFALSSLEAEKLYWNTAAPAVIMPGTDKLIAYINARGIRSGVVSNIGFSAEALTERINNALPGSSFEFVIASSEYAYRKPSPLLFELALKKAGLDAEKVWFCGDSTAADIHGASSAGIIPVWYDSRLDCPYRHKSEDARPKCEHLHIRDWTELIAVLEEADRE